ncbi:Phage protein [plant metagenome]|uniref:Phage protein n=1 Tax=plant metagenome TaxID=1297885 RepID=A0A484T8M6_9ZZZZ
MATRVSRKAKATKDAPSDLDVLHPERTVVVAGQRLTVREYGNIEWLRALPAAEPLVEAIAALLASNEAPDYEAALMAIATHTDALLPLVAQAVDVTLDFLATLDPDETEILVMTWWGVNGRFFVRRAANRVMVRLQEQQRAAPLGGARSTQPSSPPATVTPT